MPTPSSARRWLIQAVFVSTRSPRSISVPMVTISALSMPFPFVMAVFYNSPGGGLREREHYNEERPGPGPLAALGETLRPDPEGQSPKLLHGPVAAELARRELGVGDEGVLEAVRVHTTATPGMEPLALTLYVADKIEPARDYPSVERLRELAREDLYVAATESLRRAISYNEGRGKDVHPSSRAALEWLESDHAPQGGVEQQ